MYPGDFMCDSIHNLIHNGIMINKSLWWRGGKVDQQGGQDTHFCIYPRKMWLRPITSCPLILTELPPPLIGLVGGGGEGVGQGCVGVGVWRGVWLSGRFVFRG